jgi:hypothetical protein
VIEILLLNDNSIKCGCCVTVWNRIPRHAVLFVTCCLLGLYFQKVQFNDAAPTCLIVKVFSVILCHLFFKLRCRVFRAWNFCFGPASFIASRPGCPGTVNDEFLTLPQSHFKVFLNDVCLSCWIDLLIIILH